MFDPYVQFNFKLRLGSSVLGGFQELTAVELPRIEPKRKTKITKITGINKPSKVNEALFLTAVDEVADVSIRLLESLETSAPPKNREQEAAKARARAAERFGT